MDKAELMHRLDREYTLCHVESGYVLGERVILDEHGHEIATREELHNEVQVDRVLERVEELYNPSRVGFRENVALCADMR
jgi:hypothetical protein